MSILLILIPLALVLLVFAIGAFFWAVNNNQFDDLETPAYIVLLDDSEEEKAQILKNEIEEEKNKENQS